MATNRARVPKTPARTFEPTELVAQAAGYVIENGKRVDKFTLTSPVFYNAEALQAWLDNVPDNADKATRARDAADA